MVADRSFNGGDILNHAYRHESDADVRERILLVRRVRVDGKYIEDVASEELHRCRAWAYKWMKRFDEYGLDGLKSRPHTGRPTEVPEEVMLQIRKKLSENPSGWQVGQIMDTIYQKTGVRYHEVHIYRLLHKWGFSPKVPQRRFVNAASEEEKEDFKKRYRKHSHKFQKGSQ